MGGISKAYGLTGDATVSLSLAMLTMSSSIFCHECPSRSQIYLALAMNR
jgi:hypothetical protein